MAAGKKREGDRRRAEKKLNEGKENKSETKHQKDKQEQVAENHFWKKYDGRFYF